jgi:hypothetical protein
MNSKSNFLYNENTHLIFFMHEVILNSVEKKNQYFYYLNETILNTFVKNEVQSPKRNLNIQI